MKKFKIILLSILLFLPLTFIGCGKNKGVLSTPSIVSINGGTIVFDAVKDAQYYTLSINGQDLIIDASNNSYVKIENNRVYYDASKIFVVGDNYTVKVQAHASKRPSSNFSNSVNYLHNGRTYTPTNIKINGTILTWDTAENAHYYIVKMITPTDIIYDFNGTVLTQRDPETIAKANLTEYKFNTNQFDFSSLLQDAGIYKFYVCSAIGEGDDRTLSSYSSAISYTHTVQLATPVNSNVYSENGELFLNSIIDPKTNMVTVSCDEVFHTLVFENTEGIFEKIDNTENVVKINLNKFFASREIDFSQDKSFTFTTQSHYNSGTVDSFYQSSNFSSARVYNENQILGIPTLSIAYSSENSCYEAFWSSSNAGSFRVLVATPTGIKTHSLDSDVSSLLLKEEFVAVAIQAIGAHDYSSSQISDFVFNPELTSIKTSPTLDANVNTMSWSDVAANYYILTYGNEIYEVRGTSLTTPKAALHTNYNFRLTAISPDAAYPTTLLNKTLEEKLNTPTFSATQGFNSKNIYELTFTGVENAFGYYVELSRENDGFERINKLYTTTTIDLTQFITDEEGLSNWKVRVQAVAAPHSGYLNSDTSAQITVEHLQVLNSPKFFSVNGVETAIVKKYVENELRYILKFKGVSNAASYSVFINYNHFSITATANENEETIWEYDVTDYLKYANVYNISISAVPYANAHNMKESEKATTQYVVTKQLDTVQNVKVTEENGVFILSFDTVNNAHEYQVRIVKENDGNYATYLSELGLSHTFNVNFATDITRYVQQQGKYYFYVTALASPESGSFYSNANESNYATVSKLTSLKAPEILSVEASETNSSFTLTWNGDEHADYYLIQAKSANGLETEFVKQISSNDDPAHSHLSIDVQSVMNIEGNYSFTVFSMIDSTSNNSALYTASQGTKQDFVYTYKTLSDFNRSTIEMYGASANYYIDNIKELKNLLWHSYLYEQNEHGLSLMLNTSLFAEEINPVRETILSLADESYKDNIQIYDFAQDSTWQDLVMEGSSATDNDLFKYLCEKILLAYPEFNVLAWDNETPIQSEGNVFNLKYKNALNQPKQSNPSKTLFTNSSYSNPQKYIAADLRKSATGSFAIDQKDEMLVTTTEQLLHAVQSNKKPRFVGDSGVADSVYQKAKLVLSAIVSNSMNEYQKTEAIFNWLANNFDIAYYKIDGLNKISGSVENTNLTSFGLSDKYYLEGIFSAVNENGEVETRTSTTSFGYSKAFALLCRIEGIEAVVVNGSYYATELHGTIRHAWNRVNIATLTNSQKAWFSVDITFSSNVINYADFSKGYSTGSHAYFLTTSNKPTDPNSQHHLSGVDINVSQVVDLSYLTDQYHDCYTEYDYYSNAKFSITSEQIKQVLGENNLKDVSYSLNYNVTSEYQQYYSSMEGAQLQNYVVNGLISAAVNAKNNNTNKGMFEFTFNYNSVNNGSTNLDNNYDPNWHPVFNQFRQSTGVTNTVNLRTSYADTKNGTLTIIIVVDYGE